MQVVLSPQFTNLCSPGCTEQHEQHYSVYGCVDKFLPQCDAGFEVNWNMMFIKDPPEFLKYPHDVRNDNVVAFFFLLVSVGSRSFGSFDKGPAWVATGFKRYRDKLLFLLVVQGSEEPQLVLHWAMRVKQQVLICVCSVQLSVEASDFFNVYCTVQEGKTVSSDIVPPEHDVIVHSIYRICVGFHFPCSDLDPGVMDVL